MNPIVSIAQRMLNSLGFEVHRLPRFPRRPQEQQTPDAKYYRPLFSPWLGYGEFARYYDLAKHGTLVSADRCWIIYSLCRQALFLNGDIWECGVYKGGTAAMLAQIVYDGTSLKRLHLFDTFEGMPETDHVIDIHRKGDFSDTSLDAVRNYVKHNDVTVYHQGFIPETFHGLESSRIAFAHIDVDIRQSVTDCCDFIFPRLNVGGFIVFDDYGFPSCLGARQAVDTYFSKREVVPLVLPTGQAIVFKSK
jgi:O-methyltransferase